MDKNDISDGEFVAFWLWIQTGDRLAGLMRFNDLIENWYRTESENLEKQASKKLAEKVTEMKRAVVMFDPVHEERVSIELTRRTMAASLVTSVNAVIENLVIGVCQFMGLQVKQIKPHWEDAVKALDKGPRLIMETLEGYWAVRRIRLLSNCFKHQDGYVNEDLANLTSMVQGEEIQYENEDLHVLLNSTDVFLACLRDRIATL